MPATKGRAGGVSIVRPLPMGEEEAVGTGGGCPWDFKPGGSPQAQGSGRGPVVRPQGGLKEAWARRPYPRQRRGRARGGGGYDSLASVPKGCLCPGDPRGHWRPPGKAHGESRNIDPRWRLGSVRRRWKGCGLAPSVCHPSGILDTHEGSVMRDARCRKESGGQKERQPQAAGEGAGIPPAGSAMGRRPRRPRNAVGSATPAHWARVRGTQHMGR